LKDNARQLIWTGEAKRAFEQLKRELMRALALGLPNVLNPHFPMRDEALPWECWLSNWGHTRKQLDISPSSWMR